MAIVKKRPRQPQIEGLKESGLRIDRRGHAYTIADSSDGIGNELSSDN